MNKLFSQIVGCFAYRLMEENTDLCASEICFVKTISNCLNDYKLLRRANTLYTESTLLSKSKVFYFWKKENYQYIVVWLFNFPSAFWMPKNPSLI